MRAAPEIEVEGGAAVGETLVLGTGKTLYHHLARRRQHSSKPPTAVKSTTDGSGMI